MMDVRNHNAHSLGKEADNHGNREPLHIDMLSTGRGSEQDICGRMSLACPLSNPKGLQKVSV